MGKAGEKQPQTEHDSADCPATVRGPTRFLQESGWRGDLNIDERVTMSMVGTSDVCVRFQPNSRSSAGTNTLQA